MQWVDLDLACGQVLVTKARVEAEEAHREW